MDVEGILPCKMCHTFICLGDRASMEAEETGGALVEYVRTGLPAGGLPSSRAPRWNGQQHAYWRGSVEPGAFKHPMGWALPM